MELESRKGCLSQQSRSVLLDPALILDSANDAIVLTDPHFRILGLDKRAEEMHGLKAAEVVGKGVIEALVHQEYKSNGARILKRLSAGDSFCGECVNVTKDGRKIPIRLSVKAIFDSSGQSSVIWGLLRTSPK